MDGSGTRQRMPYPSFLLASVTVPQLAVPRLVVPAAQVVVTDRLGSRSRARCHRLLRYLCWCRRHARGLRTPACSRHSNAHSVPRHCADTARHSVARICCHARQRPRAGQRFYSLCARRSCWAFGQKKCRTESFTDIHAIPLVCQKQRLRQSNHFDWRSELAMTPCTSKCM